MYIKLNLNAPEANMVESKRISGGRLPRLLWSCEKKFEYFDFRCVLGRAGSQILIEYFLPKIDDPFIKNRIFAGLSSHGHLSVAQWFCSLGDVNIHY